MKDNNKKLNDGCLKILKFLLLLYEDKADYDSVISIFKDEINIQTANNLQVVLNKYLNALKIFGVKVKKEKNKFKLESSLYSMNFSNEDLKSINILLQSAKSFPDNKVNENVMAFIDNLLIRMNNQNKNKLNDFNNNYDISFFYKNIKEQIEQCENLCKDQYVTEILYKNKGKDEKIICIPKEIIYDSKNVYIKVYNNSKNQKIDIPVGNILFIKKLPQKAASTDITTTVVYKLKGRLANTYKIKENEYTNGNDENGNLIVVNKNESYDKLLNRLMRYYYNCEIITPKVCREKMKELINETLNNYDS